MQDDNTDNNPVSPEQQGAPSVVNNSIQPQGAGAKSTEPRANEQVLQTGSETQAQVFSASAGNVLPQNSIDTPMTGATPTIQGAAPGMPTSSDVTPDEVLVEMDSTEVVNATVVPEEQPTPTVGSAPIISAAQVGPMENTVDSATSSAASGGKKKTGLIWGIVGGVVGLAIIVTIVLLLVFGVFGKKISVDSVKKVCEEKQLEIETSRDEEHDMDTIACNAQGNSDVASLEFYLADKPFSEMEDLDMNEAESLFASFGGETLVNDANYKKYYATIFGRSVYEVIKDNTAIMIAGENDAIKNVLIKIGYPDDKWGNGNTASSQDSYLWDELEDSSDEYSSALQEEAQRRNDLARLETAIIAYQIDNGSLPEGPSYWEGTETLDCSGEGTIACEVIKNYISSDGNNNEFVSPDGEPYSIYITENWATNGSITPESGNTFSYLEEKSDGYTIGGMYPFSENIAFVVPGGQCSGDGEDISVIKGQSAGDFAIMHILEDDSVYCVDNL